MKRTLLTAAAIVLLSGGAAWAADMAMDCCKDCACCKDKDAETPAPAPSPQD